MELFVVPHTHWDREWYMTFEESRKKLVNLMDILLVVLENDPDFRFMLDGQTIVLEDYLETKPENEGRLRKLITAGRLSVGPWYVQPDEFLVSGESLIRNLLVGEDIAERFGKKMNAGYLPDSFGHICEMPMILRGFGIDSFIFMRGAGDEIKKSIFTWNYRDGSSVTAMHLLPGYDNGAQISCISADMMRDRIEILSELHSIRGSGEPLLLMDGSDHLLPEPDIAERLKKMTGHLKLGDVEEYMGGEHRIELTYNGELRESKYSPILPGVLSARTYLKQRNRELEDLLLFYAEPLSLYAMLSGGKHNELPWKELMKNHAHDSICGCGIDAVHSENAERFDRVEKGIRSVMSDCTREISSDDGSFSVYNPLNWNRREPVCIDASPEEMLVNSKGEPVAYAIRDGKATFIADVKGLSFENYRFVEGANEQKGSVAAENGAIENEFFKVEVNEGGSLDVYDKNNNRWFRGLNAFCDISDRGDEYNFCAAGDPTYPEVFETRIVYSTPIMAILRTEISFGSSAEKSPLSIVSEIRLCSKVPRVDFTTEVRNSRKDHRLSVMFPFNGRVIAGSKFGSVERKHTEHYTRDDKEAELIEKITRAHRPDNREKGWIEDPADSYPFDRFVHTDGLTIAAKGLFEYSFVDGMLGITLLRCTGKLSKGDLSCRRGHAGPDIDTPEAQCIGNYKYEYAISSGDESSAIKDAMNHNVPMLALKGRIDDGISVHPESVVLSCLKAAEDSDGIIVRLYNPGKEPVRGVIRFGHRITGAWEVDLREKEKKAVSFSEDTAEFEAKPFALLSVRICVEHQKWIEQGSNIYSQKNIT